MRIAPIVLGGIVALLAIFLIAVPKYDRPPLVTFGYGAPGLELSNFVDPRRPTATSVVPAPLPDATSDGGPLAKDVYKNVQVLGDLPKPDFDRVMVAITQWVAPKQGCAFCHDVKPGADGKVNYADDALYTDKVARRMIQMTMHINADWGNHVAPSGVVCYTCHRGENIPPNVWYRQPEPMHVGFLGKPRNWQTNAKSIQDFFPTDGYEKWLVHDDDAKIESQAALPGEKGSGVSSEQTAEQLYVMMMQWSNAIGNNCNLCHNSRNIYDWDQSSPYRLDALWAQHMTQDLNNNHVIPLAALIPKDQLGQLGDAGKIECGTCHASQNKPLGGFDLLAHYPFLGPKGGPSAGADQAVRDAMHPIEVIGPAWSPLAKVVDVSIPAYPAPEAAAAPASAPTPAVATEPAPAPAPAATPAAPEATPAAPEPTPAPTPVPVVPPTTPAAPAPATP